MTPPTGDPPLMQPAHRRSRHWGATGEALLAAGLYSLAPLTIHYTATGANPLIFNSISRSIQALVLLLYLKATRARYFADQPTIRAVVDFALAGVRPDKSDKCNHSTLRLFSRLTTVTGKSKPVGPGTTRRGRLFYGLVPLATLPMVWTIISRTDYALYAWSTHYIDVAVSATIFELWPLMMVIFVSLFSGNDRQNQYKHISGYQMTLMCAAFIGLALLILGQSGTSIDAIQLFASHGTKGIGLALLAAIMAGIGPASAIYLGHLLQYGYSRSSLTQPDCHGSQENVERPNNHIRNVPLPEQQRLWFALVVSAIAYTVTGPANLLIALTGISGAFQISVRSVLGSVLLGGAILASSGLLLQRANARPEGLRINAVFYFTPIISVLLLAVIPGISLARPDLFWIGASLVLALNLIIQSSPDEEPDYAQYGTEAPPGVRLGFTSLILALWAFGTFIYMRDEILPSSWIVWKGTDFWTLLALSATVFALIFGFRVARLSGRLTAEDNMFLDLYRQCEYYVDRKVLVPECLDDLRKFDVAEPVDLPHRYDILTNRFYESERLLRKRRNRYLTSAKDIGEVSSLDTDSKNLSTIRRKLDQLAHSKQQGKDISELISICIFAGITVSLGLLARPLKLGPIQLGWTGFLSELFVTLFVSIVAFLAFNLFDMRRDRLIPLISQTSDNPQRLTLFFRHRSDPVLPQRMSVLITILIIVMFTVLLYDKWL